MAMRRSRRQRFTDAANRVEDDNTARVRQQRIDIDGGDFRQIAGELREFDKCEGNGLDIGRRTAVETFQQPEDPCTGYRFVRQLHVQRR